MEVITFLPTENHMQRSVLPNISVAVTFQFPILFMVMIATLLIFAPSVQNKIGLYRLEKIDFLSDGLSDNTIRSHFFPPVELDLVEQSGVGELSSIQAVRYSTYVVRSGDSVSAIAVRFGLRNISTILSVNSIDNARRISSGQKLRIPNMDGIQYTVIRGDTLEKISQKFSADVTMLLDVNDIETSVLSIGQKLFIPGATLSTTDLRKAMGELFIFPIKGRLTSPYGYRNDPFTGVRTFHTGIDLAAPSGTSIKATLDGKVVTTGFSPVYGNYVIISHDLGYQSLYAHLSSILVKRSQYVTQSAIIGRVGNTGYSTGSHLHFSVYKNGKMIDPYSVLK